MTHADYAKAIWEGAAAVAAIIAAVFWRAASKQPVAKYAPAYYDVSANDLAPANDQIQRGAALNARAALWAAVAALFQGMALLIGIVWR
jgi:hypothetical protein